MSANKYPPGWWCWSRSRRRDWLAQERDYRAARARLFWRAALTHLTPETRAQYVADFDAAKAECERLKPEGWTFDLEAQRWTPDLETRWRG